MATWAISIMSILACLIGFTQRGCAQDKSLPSTDTQKKPIPPDRKTDPLPVMLGKIPALVLARRPPLDKSKIDRIKECIAQLATIDSPDYGLSTTMSGVAFLPLPGHGTPQAFLLTNHRLKSAETLRKLVELGPDSLSFLLARLDDTTPTKLKITHGWRDGAMYYANELGGNPVNPIEVKALESRRKSSLEDRKYIHTYTVKVGDICLVAIGQIVGRPYQAVRYQPTACIVINSPTEDAELCKQVRTIWSSNDSARRLFDSLLLDYATEGIHGQGEGLDNWDVGSRLQTEAAMRLLYYFPKETALMIARRLQGLQVQRTGPGSGSLSTQSEFANWRARELANGVRAEYFVKALSWCEEPSVRSAMRSIFERTGDPDILVAAIPGIDNSEDRLIRTRIEAILGMVSKEEGGAYGDGYNLLLALLERTPQAAKPVFVRYLHNASAQRCHTVSEILQRRNPSWSTELLQPLLKDKRSTGYTHAVSVRESESRLPIRVCDAAAKALSRWDKQLKFKMVGSNEELDRQIQTILDQLAQGQHE